MKLGRKYKNASGFTLIELMIVVAVVAILAAVAYPSYSDYIRKSRRSDGMNALLAVQLAQERMRANCRYYAQNLGSSDSCGASAGATTIKVNDSSSEGFYDLEIVSGSANTAAYVATASAATSDQGKDDEQGQNCGVLTLTVSAGSPSGSKTPSECW